MLPEPGCVKMYRMINLAMGILIGYVLGRWGKHLKSLWQLGK